MTEMCSYCTKPATGLRGEAGGKTKPACDDHKDDLPVFSGLMREVFN